MTADLRDTSAHRSPRGGLLRRLGRRAACNRGNVTMLFGFAIIPLTFATGMAIDYTRAMTLQTRLNVAADAAALAAVSRMNIDLPTSQAEDIARKLFIAQSEAMIDDGKLTLDYTASNDLSITIHDDTSAVTKVRTATVTYRGLSNNIFGGILGRDTLNIEGSSTAKASDAPDIDFYVMVDTSPSMLLPATSAGLATMIQKTPDKCAFACHITNSKNDYYAIARNNKLVLRTDLVTKAVQDLTVTATTVMTNNNTTYRMGLFDFDYMFRKIWPTSANAQKLWVDSDLSVVKTHATDSVPLTYCSNNYRVCNVNDDDTATNFTSAMNGINDVMPTPGHGTGETGDTPQVVLFLITDGMRDEKTNKRVMGPIPASLCDTIKNRNIRIAVLETQYLPESASDDWSISNVKTPFLSPTNTISPALSSCATSGLYYQVTTDSDISAALSELFQAVVSSAHLTQ